MSEEYLTIDQVADLFKVTKRTVENWIKYDNLPYLSVKKGKGRQRRFLESKVREWFEKN